MAKKPNPKQNFLQSLLLITTIYLGILLIFRPGQSGPTKYAGQELSKPDQVMTALRDADRNIMDLDAAQKLYPALKSSLDQEVKDKKITQDQEDRLLIEGSVLVADTQLKAGLIRNETGRVRAAYQTLVNLEKQHLDTPEWKQEYELPRKPGDSKRFVWDRASGESLYAQTVTELSNRNKNDYIWGFIPGGYQFIDFIVHLTGAQPGVSYALAAFLLALVVRAIVFPLTQKQLMFGREMSQLTPLVNEIKKKYEGKDQTEMNAKVMELYREYGINPMAGCGPMLLQMPLFLTVYQCMLHYQFEFQKGVFLWINPVTSRAAPAFIAPNLGQRDVPLIALYGISMVFSTLMTPVSDPTQVRQQRMIGVSMSVMFTFFMFTGAFPVPAAFVLYWTFTNMLAMAQSFRAYRLPLPPLQKVNAPGGGVYPQGGASKWMQRLEELQRQSDGQKKGGASSSNGQIPKAEVITGDVKTGTPAKHRPKRRK